VIDLDATPPLMRVQSLSCAYGKRNVVRDISFDLWPGEVLAIVGESGSGKTTLLNAVAARHTPSAGHVSFDLRNQGLQNIYEMSEAQRRMLARTDWGFVHQNAADGLRMNVSAGAM
jgi:putative phosphonate transport system ATP-binding protein